MKKTIAFLLAALLLFVLTACGGNTGTETSTPESTAGDTGTDSTVSASSAAEETAAYESSAPATVSETEETPETGKVLVVYFSATNTTKGIAQMIADCLNADQYEIIPEQLYTDEDLNYHDGDSRTTAEMNDPNARPAISGSVENMAQYDIILLGYPIWWGDAPRILCTFVESCDLSGKTIIPFCTSGSSGIGSSAKNLERLTSGANWQSGTRFSGNASLESVAEWLRDLGLNLNVQ